MSGRWREEGWAKSRGKEGHCTFDILIKVTLSTVGDKRARSALLHSGGGVCNLVPSTLCVCDRRGSPILSLTSAIRALRKTYCSTPTPAANPHDLLLSLPTSSFSPAHDGIPNPKTGERYNWKGYLLVRRNTHSTSTGEREMLSCTIYLLLRLVNICLRIRQIREMRRMEELAFIEENVWILQQQLLHGNHFCFSTFPAPPIILTRNFHSNNFFK